MCLSGADVMLQKRIFGERLDERDPHPPLRVRSQVTAKVTYCKESQEVLFFFCLPVNIKFQKVLGAVQSLLDCHYVHHYVYIYKSMEVTLKVYT